MISLAPHKLCSGCTACQAACGRGALTMREDVDGFRYPLIDPAICVECGACVKICPVLNPAQTRLPMRCYAAKSKDDVLRQQSSSGGVFTELAVPVLKDGGCVYGCVMESGTFQVYHTKAEDTRGLAAMRKSKYVQSDLKDVFRDLRKEVENGRRVLFSGTPCQISGLRSFLGKDYENLLLVGIVCHGAPSYKLMMRFIECKQKKCASRFETFDFRSKATGWKNFAIQCDDAQGTSQYVEGQMTNSYMGLFNGNVAFRESCYNCLSRAGRAPTDVLIGDFWGVESLCAEMDDQKGTSVILAYTERGEKALRGTGLDLREISFDAATRFNRNVQASEKRPLLRSVIYPLLNWLPFDFVARLYRMMCLSEWEKAMYGIYRHVRPILVRLGMKQ